MSDTNLEAAPLDLTPRGSLAIEYVVNGPVETNTYFVISGGEALVIDPAWEGERLVEEFSRRHPDVRLAGIACTHGHADHVGGVAGVRRALGEDLPFALAEEDVPMIRSNIEHQRINWGIDTEDPGEPNRLLVEGDVVSVGDVRLQVLSTPGHTPGGVVLFAETQEGPVAFVGDTLFPGGHGRVDLEGGDWLAIMRSLAKLGTLLPPETQVFVGHGSGTTIAQELEGNPFMQRALLDQRRREGHMRRDSE